MENNINTINITKKQKNYDEYFINDNNNASDENNFRRKSDIFKQNNNIILTDTINTRYSEETTKEKYFSNSITKEYNYNSNKIPNKKFDFLATSKVNSISNTTNNQPDSNDNDKIYWELVKQLY